MTGALLVFIFASAITQRSERPSALAALELAA
jgi:hypothetical protein